jgi:hypothetical protein
MRLIDIIALMLALSVVALLLANRLWDLYQAERRSHQITLNAFADAVSRESAAYEAGVRIGKSMQRIHVAEDGETIAVPVMDLEEVGRAG